MALLSVQNLSLEIGQTPILKRVSFQVDHGKILGIIGESGSGKTMAANAIVQLVPEGTRIHGDIKLCGDRLLDKSDNAMNAVRGNQIGMIFQEPMTALNPVLTIGDQVAEALLQHHDMSRDDALNRARHILERVGLPPDQFPLSRYPHELSGGQRQRVVIAMAIINKPDLLIADEPSTALDVTTQAQILKLLNDLVVEDQIGLIFITHDLAVVSDMADDLVIMKKGEVVDGGQVRDILSQRQHPYTQLLFESSNHQPVRRHRPQTVNEKLLQVTHVTRDYILPKPHLFAKRSTFRAVNRVSFEIMRGENVGLVGESGCGKSTLARALLGLEPIQEGEIFLSGAPLLQRGRVSAELRRKIQVVFQDPYASFNPRHKVGRLIAEPLFLSGRKLTQQERMRGVEKALEQVHLPSNSIDKYIHEFSGGQRQRIAIARALINEPELIILDEAVSALDVSVRAQILDLLAELSDQRQLSYLFISHDLSVVRNITDRVLVMKGGDIIEQGPTRQIFDQPKALYTQSLIAAIPKFAQS